ncbi:kinase-like domain-containing protein [Infundibulicybe gibba]|nr:kinase-like domain-containing protein [Infundibulicybe gibba]
MVPLRQWGIQTYSAYIAYTIAVWTFDTLDDAIHLLYKPRRPIRDYEPSDIDHLSIEEVRALMVQAPPLSSDPLRGSELKRLTSKLVFKDSEDVKDTTSDTAEGLALLLVFQETTIPVPRLRKVVESEIVRYIIMDHIPGRQLSEVWPSLGYMRRIWVAITLRRYIRQLRAIKPQDAPVPGPLSLDRPRKCESPPIFGPIRPSRGPFASYAEMSAFFNKRDSMIPRKAGAPSQPFDDSKPLVFTHQDLNMRNIIVGDDGRLWLIDWAWAGYYPCWFEFVAMKEQARNEERVVDRKEPFWDALIPFICDPYFSQEIWHDRMAGAFMYK